MARPTIRDVAKEAGVSTALISFALNDREGVAPATRQRILEIADRLGYQADPHARALRTGTTNVYGLVVRNLQNPFFVEVVSGSQAAASASDATMMVIDSDYQTEREIEHIQALVTQRVSGLAIAPVGPGAAVERWMELCPGKPTVILNADAPGLTGVSRVSADNEAAVRLAVEHLVSLGHRRITFLTAPAKLMADHDRLELFFQMCQEYDVEPDPRETRLALDSVYQTVLSLLVGRSKPTAVVTNSDFSAQAVYLAARTAGLRVGEQLSVVGHDDLPTSALLDPPLTTLRLDRRAIGHAVFARLVEDHGLSDHREPVELVVRRSTGHSPSS